MHNDCFWEYLSKNYPRQISVLGTKKLKNKSTFKTNVTKLTLFFQIFYLTFVFNTFRTKNCKSRHSDCTVLKWSEKKAQLCIKKPKGWPEGRDRQRVKCASANRWPYRWGRVRFVQGGPDPETGWLKWLSVRRADTQVLDEGKILGWPSGTLGSRLRPCPRTRLPFLWDSLFLERLSLKNKVEFKCNNQAF